MPEKQVICRLLDGMVADSSLQDSLTECTVTMENDIIPAGWQESCSIGDSSMAGGTVWLSSGSLSNAPLYIKHWI